MPQSVPWEEVPERSPFLKLLTEYMWSHRPPLTVGQLAVKTDISKHTIWGWIRNNRIPRPALLKQIAATTTIPLEDLYRACGYALPGEEDAASGRERNPFARMIAGIQRDPMLSPRAKQAIIDSIMRVELGEAEAERQRMIYTEQHTTVDGLPVVRKESEQHQSVPETAQRAAPSARPRVRQAPHAPKARPAAASQSRH